jgi:two-component system, LuxR family, sensor kinase FixL
MRAPLSENEAARLGALQKYKILNSAPEESFDDLAHLAAQICSSPVALISFIDSDRQWLKSKVGISLNEISRDVALCAHAILQTEPLVIKDTLEDKRFATNPLVTSDPRIRFYAAAPLVTAEGFVIGTICVFDRVPKDIGSEQIQALKALSRQVMRLLEMKRKIEIMESSITEHERTESDMKKRSTFVELLQSVAIAANESLTVEGAMRTCLNRICSMTGWQIGHLYLLIDDYQGKMEPMTMWHLNDLERFETFQRVTEFTRFAVESGMIGEIVSTGKPVYVSDINKYENFALSKVAVELGIRSGIAFPVIIGTEIIGAMEFYSTETIEQDEQLSAVLAHICAQVARVVERKQATEALRNSENQFRAIFDKAAIGISLVDMEGRLIESNRTLQEMLGYSEIELRDKLFTDITHPDDAMADWNLFKELIEGNLDQYRIEKRYQSRDGRLVWGNLIVSLIRNARGNPQFAINLVENITSRKDAEEKLRSFAARLEQSNRELQDFAYVASHDLQEPLRKIQAFGDRLKVKSEGKLDDTCRGYLERMQDAAGRMQILINDLLTLSRITIKAQPFEPVDLNKIIKETLPNLELRIEQTGGRIEFAELPVIEADPLQMRQLFQNLIGNALKFHQEKEPPIVKIKVRTYEDDQISRSETDYRICEISVEDNGIGFDEKYLDRIFTVFQRLHNREDYQGTGIGLAICRKIAERHGGTITARSSPGQGSRFIVTLPFKQPKAEVEI